ncbi:MAG: hypothetical protein WCP77_22835 [Roseococcus sp.]
MLKAPFLFGLIGALAGCAQQATLLPRPADGYRAIRFERPFSAQILTQVTSVTVGSIYIHDRVKTVDGTELWCSGAGQAFTCIALRAGQLRLHAEVPAIGEAWWDVPPGTISEIRIP